MEKDAEFYITRGISKAVNGVIAILLIVCLLYAGYALYDSYLVINHSSSVQQQLLRYKPTPEELKYSFEQLRALNPDVCAWVTIDNTKIDYPVVQGEDNFDYLSTDVLGQPAASGSIFLDSGNKKDFSDNYNMLMGHHMQGGEMFGDIDLFLGEAFFNSNFTGTLSLPDKVYSLEVVAVLSADAYDKVMYTVGANSDSEMSSLIQRIDELAIFKRGSALAQNDKILALSTCSTGYTNARTILICRMTEQS